jgi:hypothetical protein
VRTIFFILILAVLALIAAIATGFLDVRQTQSAQVPEISASGNGVTATGGQAPSFDVETGSVSVGTKPANVAVPVPTLSVNQPAPPRILPPRPRRRRLTVNDKDDMTVVAPGASRVR